MVDVPGPNRLLNALEDLGASPRFAAIVKSDDTVLDPLPRMVYVGGEGDLVVRGDDGVDATFAVQDGSYHPISPTRVLAATTATGLVALY